MIAGSIEIQLLANLARLQSDMDKAQKTVGTAMQKIEAQARMAMNALGGIAGALSIRELSQAVDTYTKLTAQLKLATNSAEEYAQAYRNVQRISRDAQVDLSATAQIYARLSNAMRDAGKSQKQISDISETISLALRVSGATAQESASAMLQLAQAFGSGRLAGEEFRAVSESAPPLLRELARAIGVPVGALKDLAKEGKLTADVLANAWSNPEYLARLREQVKEVATSSSAIVVLKNNFITWLGEMDKAEGASKTLAAGILGLADNIKYLVSIVGSLVAGRLAQYVATSTIEFGKAAIAARAKALATLEAARADAVAKAESVALTAARVAELRSAIAATSGYVQLEIATNGLIPAQARAAAAVQAHATSLNTLNAAQKAASITSGVVGGAITLLGGPIGALITILGLAATAWAVFGNSAENAAMKNESAVDRALAKLNQLREQQLVADSKNNPIAVELAEAAKRYSDAVANVRNVTNIHGDSVRYGVEQMEKAKAELDRVTAAYREAETIIAKQASAHHVAAAATTENAAATEKLAQKIAALDEAERNYNMGKFEEDGRKIQQGYKLLEQQDDVLDSLVREAAGYDELSKTEQMLWEIERGRFKDFTEWHKERILATAKEIDAQKKVADLQEQANKNYKAAQEEAARIDKERRDEQIKVWESIEKTAHDTFISIFDSGKSAFDRLRDALKNGLYELLWQMVHSKWIIPIQTAVMGGASGTALAAGEVGGIPTGSGSGIGLGSIKSVFDVVTKGFGAANNLFLSGIQDFGASVANLGGIFGDVGSWITMNGSTIAAVAPFIPSIISILSGDLKGGIASGIGAGIGMAIGGPVGGAIGSAIGGLVGGLFGGKKKPPQYGAQSFANYSGGEVTGYAKNNGRSLGGDALTSMDALTKGFVETIGKFTKAFGVEAQASAMAYFRKRTTIRGNFGASIDGQGLWIEEAYGKKDIAQGFEKFVNTVMGPMLVQAIQKSRLPGGIKTLFDGMTDRAQVMNMINATLGLNSAQEQLAERFGLTVDKAGRVSKATGLAGDDLIKFVNALASAALSFKTAGEVLIEARDTLTESFSESGGGSSLPGTLKAFDDILKGIDKTTQAGIQQFADLFAIREQFSQYTQAIDSLKGGVKGALFGIVSPGEQQAMMQADLAELFGVLNLQIPGSVQELIDLGKSIDYTTEEGLNLAAAFPSLVAAFQQTREQVDALTESLLDVNRFATLVDYTRAQRYASSGIDVSSLPSYDVGTAFVPADGPAMIHQGERILTSSENAAMVGAVQANAAAIARLEQKIEAGLYAVATNTGETARRIRKWDGDGMPETRTIPA